MASTILFQRGAIAARWNSWGSGSDGTGPHYEVNFARGQRARFYQTEAEAVRCAKRAAAKIFPDPRRLAKEFARQLFACLSIEEWAEMRRLNAAETSPNVCHSHDYVDANMVMQDAWRACVRDKNWALASEAEDPGLVEVQCDIWNRAWDIAKAKHLSEASR